MGTIRICAGVNAFDSTKQHVHSGRKQDAAFFAASQGSNRQHNTHSMNGILCFTFRKNGVCQFLQGNGSPSAKLKHLTERFIRNEMIIQPMTCAIHIHKGSWCPRNTGPEMIQCIQSLGVIALERFGFHPNKMRQWKIIAALCTKLFFFTGQIAERMIIIRGSQRIGEVPHLLAVFFVIVWHTGSGQNKLDSAPIDS